MASRLVAGNPFKGAFLRLRILLPPWPPRSSPRLPSPQTPSMLACNWWWRVASTAWDSKRLWRHCARANPSLSSFPTTALLCARVRLSIMPCSRRPVCTTSMVTTMSLALPVDGIIEWAASLSLTLETPTSSAASQAKSESTAAQPTEFKVDAEGEALPKRVLRMPGDSALAVDEHTSLQ